MIAGVARGQDPRADADRLMNEGMALGRAGNNLEAIRRFRAAEALLPRFQDDCNIGLAWARLQQWARAELYLSRCRERAVAERAVDQLPAWVNERLREADAALGQAGWARVEVASDPAGAKVVASAFGVDDPFVAPRTVWLPPGAQDVLATLDGRRPERVTFTVEPGVARAVRVTLRANPPPVATTPPPVEKAASPPAHPAAPTSAAGKSLGERVGRRRLVVAGALTLAAGVALLAGALTANLLAQGPRSAIPNAEIDVDYQRDLAALHSYRAAAITLYVVGGAAAATGLALVIAGRRLRPSLAIGPGAAALSLAGSW